MPNGTASDFGTVNTLISPLNLSWNLQNGLFVSFGLTFYPPDGTYNVANAVHVSRNYFTFEPGIGISYLANGWNITLHPVFDINATNPVNGYKSGNVFVMDYSISHKIGAFEIGLGGNLQEQFTNDAINGVTVASVPGTHGFGNRVSDLGVGPVVGYDFGSVALRAFWLRDVYARNTARRQPLLRAARSSSDQRHCDQSRSA